MHPLRVQYQMFSDANPLMAPIKAAAEKVRSERKPIASGNPFLAMQENMSRQIVNGLDQWRQASENGRTHFPGGLRVARIAGGLRN